MKLQTLSVFKTFFLFGIIHGLDVMTTLSIVAFIYHVCNLSCKHSVGTDTWTYQKLFHIDNITWPKLTESFIEITLVELKLMTHPPF